MKKLFMFCLLGLFVTASCNRNKQTTSNGEKLDTVWNEKVQDTFYGLRLGDSLDVSTIVSTLNSHGFWFAEKYSTENLLHFSYRQSQYFTFGEIGFEMLDVLRDNGVLTGVRFMNSSKDKASSLDAYNNIKNRMDSKYSPTPITSNDTTVYALTHYYGKNKIYAVVSCFRYESIGKEILIGMRLQYGKTNSLKAPSDEL